MTELLKLKSVDSVENLQGLRQFYDALESYIRSLSMKVDSRSYGALLTPIVMEKLPQQVQLLLRDHSTVT